MLSGVCMIVSLVEVCYCVRPTVLSGVGMIVSLGVLTVHSTTAILPKHAAPSCNAADVVSHG